jgi:histidinol-phosphate/aromatic aminotransferase/cobyric acid decarboxylase-like protein
MPRFLDYYRQFDELSPEEVSRSLRERRDSERASELAEQPVLDLSGAGWGFPPHPEVVNAATFALRRAVNEYPDDFELRSAIATAHGVDASRIVVGHGASELIRAALRAVAGREVSVAWPGWGPVPGLVREAGARPVAVSLESLFERVSWSAEPPAAHTIVLSRPADPTGAVVPLAEVARLAEGLGPRAWLILDEALAGFLPDGEDGLIEHPRVLHVRSFSKAHAMAGFRIGYAILPADAPELGLAPVLGVGAAALAGALWAVTYGSASAARRRDGAAAERARLVAEGFHISPGHGPYVWLAASDGRALTEALAARRIYVAPGSAWGDDHHVRITLRDAAATDRLIEALRALA